MRARKLSVELIFFLLEVSYYFHNVAGTATS